MSEKTFDRLVVPRAVGLRDPRGARDARRETFRKRSGCGRGRSDGGRRDL